jgi:hypothetical protein
LEKRPRRDANKTADWWPVLAVKKQFSSRRKEERGWEGIGDKFIKERKGGDFVKGFLRKKGRRKPSFPGFPRGKEAPSKASSVFSGVLNTPKTLGVLCALRGGCVLSLHPLRLGGEIVFSAGASQVASSIHGHRGPRDPTGVVRGEEHDEIRHLFRISHSAKGVSGFAVLQEALVGIFVQTPLSVEITHDDAGIDRVDAHTLFGELESGASGELIHG